MTNRETAQTRLYMENPTMEEEGEAESEAVAVADFVMKEVSDWDDEVKSKARFKAFSGQRSDWESLFLFWRDLIIKVARHLQIFIIRPSNVQFLWFRRNGLSPLCLHCVLIEMHRAGDLLPQISSTNSTTVISRLSHLFRKSINFLVDSPSISSHDTLALAGDYYILSSLLEEKALEVVKILSENHWTISCVITMRKFQEICGGWKESLAILSYLSAQGKASSFVLNTTERIEGVKVCLAPRAVSRPLDMDYSVLHLIWTGENLERRLNVIDQRYQIIRNSALASLKSGNKRIALRHARELKQTSLSREKCTTLFERVEQVIQVIADAESSKMVSNAIQYSNRAMRENQINVEEVALCLQEIDENILSMKEVDNVLESSPAYAEIDDGDIEDELNKLQLEVDREMIPLPSDRSVSSTTDVLGAALSNLNLKYKASNGSDTTESCEKPAYNKNKQKAPVFTEF